MVYGKGRKRQEKPISAHAQISDWDKTIDLFEHNTLFPSKIGLVVGDGFEPSKA